MRPVLFFFLLATNLIGQTNNSSVPTAVYVMNSYTLQAEEGVELHFELQQPNGQYFCTAIHYTDANGMVHLSLQPNLRYSITSKKSNYYTQITLLETKDLARTNKNRFNISLRPKFCYRLKGEVQGEQHLWKGAYLTMTNITTQESQNVAINQQGQYYTCGTCGETYAIGIIIKDKIQKLDTLYLASSQCQGEGNPLLYFNLELKPQPIAPPKQQPTPNKIAALAIGDSLVVENLTFEGKTKKLGVKAQKALEKLMSALKSEPELFIELLVHTDSRKSERYNWLLAQKRGALLEKHMKEQGIAPDRYVIVPVGEGRILNQCTNKKNCTTAEHAVNNRIEIVRHPLKKNLDKF